MAVFKINPDQHAQETIQFSCQNCSCSKKKDCCKKYKKKGVHCKKCPKL